MIMSGVKYAKKLIRHFEGLMLVPYKCPAGYWTIGYGHVMRDGGGKIRRDVDPGDKQTWITEADAEALLDADVSLVVALIMPMIKTELSPKQYGAIIDFVFNIGHRAFAQSTVLKMINQNDLAGVPLQFMRWVYVTDPKTKTKKPLLGLERRRKAEARLWNGASLREALSG